jgi:hypothetical protein
MSTSRNAFAQLAALRRDIAAFNLPQFVKGLALGFVPLVVAILVVVVR